MTTPWLLLAVLTLGYLLGRARPLCRARDWAYWEIHCNAATRWPSLPLVAAVVLCPEVLIRAVRLRRKAKRKPQVADMPPAETRHP